MADTPQMTTATTKIKRSGPAIRAILAAASPAECAHFEAELAEALARWGRVVWLEIAREHYASLPATAREQIDTRTEQLLENSRPQPRSAYDEATDQWTTTYGGVPTNERHKHSNIQAEIEG
jgi:hypothetical protein